MLTRTHKNLGVKPWLFDEFIGVVKESFEVFNIEPED